jgi:hypothetical protein
VEIVVLKKKLSWVNIWSFGCIDSKQILELTGPRSVTKYVRQVFYDILKCYFTNFGTGDDQDDGELSFTNSSDRNVFFSGTYLCFSSLNKED